jgi:hypothetical protein
MSQDQVTELFGKLAVEAVMGEPVSISYFPVSRENTGKFAEFPTNRQQ